MGYRTQTNFVSIASVFAAVVVLGAMDSGNIVLAKIMEAFPDVPAATVRLVGTMPSVVTMVATVLVGGVVGKRISYRTTLVLAMALIVVGGTAPVLYHSDMTALLVMRGIYGFGLGLLNCRHGYLMLVTAGEARKTVLSHMQLVQSLSALALPIVCGWLGDIHWTYAFLPFLIGVIPLVMFARFTKEPEIGSPEETRTEEAEPAGGKEKPSPWSRVYYLLAFVFGLAGLTWTVGMSTLLAERGIESSAMVSVGIVACQLGGVAGGVLFKYLSGFNQKRTVPCAALSLAIGAFLMVVADSIALTVVAGIFAGFGYLTAVISFNTYSALSTPRSTVTSVTTKVLASQAVATFLTGYFIEICGNALAFAPTFTAAAFLVSGIVMAACFVLGLVVDLGPRTPREGRG